MKCTIFRDFPKLRGSFWTWVALSIFLFPITSFSATPGEVTGEQKRWHRVTITFQGPSTSEDAPTNPFLDYRLDVTFSHAGSGKTRVVPGFFAADGNAGETSATSGSAWRVHFTPEEVGTWTYVASFRSGTDVAVSSNPLAGTADPSIDGASDSFVIADTDKASPDHRGKGLLQYVGEHYFRFQNGDWYLKGGADSPENFLGYHEFDGTYDSWGSFLHAYAAHIGDWSPGDPTWQGGKGKGILGALNYLASEGMNVVYFLTYNVDGGDGADVWMWTDHTEKFRFDVSKLAQWENVFSHMTQKGIVLHVITQETENDQGLDGGTLGTERKLYYRELIARFGHHPALVWNLGEENTNTTAQQKAFADHIRGLDPYDHPIVVHTYPNQQQVVYPPLLGFPNLEGPSVQSSVPGVVHGQTKEWRDRSAAAGHKWVVNSDEIGPYSIGVLPDANDPNHDDIRKDVLWGNLMGGGGGVEYYFGYSYPHDDLSCEDWRTRDNMWEQTRYALEFFHTYLPFNTMNHCDDLVSGSNYCFSDPGNIYALYLRNGGSATLNIQAGDYEVLWYDPRGGGALQNGTVSMITGPGTVSVGQAPFSGDSVALVRLGDPAAVRAVALATPSTITLPVNSTTLDGTGSQGDIVSYLWEKVSGGQASLQSPQTASTLVTGLEEGTYTFRLTVTDAQNDTDTDELSVLVWPEGGPPGPAIVSFTLVNADTDSDIQELTNGASLDLTTLPTTNLNVRANPGAEPVGSVVFGYDGNPQYRTESQAPFALAGDVSGDYIAWTPSAGNHTLTATPYSGSGGTGTAGDGLTISFSVTDEPDTQGPAAPENLRIDSVITP